MKRICVYSGSNPGVRPEYKEYARLLGDVFLEKELELVYGGSQFGLMGEIANHIIQKGGQVTGVMPKGLFPDEVVHRRLTQLLEVKDMHERKKTMADLADGFIALPGGIGTFDELFEILSWAQLGIHCKPVGALNVSGFYAPVVALLENAAREGFMHPSNVELLILSADPWKLVEEMEHFTPAEPLTKWKDMKG